MKSESTWRSIRSERREEHGQSWMLAAALLDKPRTVDEFQEYYRMMGRRFGIFFHLLDRNQAKMRLGLERGLGELIRKGWATEEGGTYRITEAGKTEAELMLRDLERGGRFLDHATRPEAVSKTTMIVHFVLAAFKFPAALISGSVGLLNDALDTLMDGISSLCVYLGVKKGLERPVSYLLLLFMAVTGVYTLYESVIRIVRPVPLATDWTALTVVVLSAGISALLWLYQRYVGLKHGCVPLIAQSIDSRNHIIVAGGVGAGLIAAAFHFPLLDRIVALAVAILILKGSGELLIDLLRSRGEEEIDLSKYGFAWFETNQQRQMVRWILYEIENGHISSREQILREMQVATDFAAIAAFRALGFDKRANQEATMNNAIGEVFDRGLVEETGRGETELTLRLTPAGSRELDRALANSWSVGSEVYPEGEGGAALKGLRFTLGFLTTLVHVAVLYAALRWIIGLLPDLDVWAEGQLLGGCWLSRSLRIGPFTLTLAQSLCALCGTIFMYRGKLLIRQARHALHHATERGQEQPSFLLIDGPFAARRHPLYAGIIAANVGLGIALHSAYALAWAGASILIRVLGIGREERRLAAWFGQEYSDYRAKVTRALFPWWGWTLILAAYGLAWLGL